MMTASEWPSAHELCATVFELTRGMTQMNEPSNEPPINGHEIPGMAAQPPPEPAVQAVRFKENDAVTTSDILMERTFRGDPMPNRRTATVGVVVGIRPQDELAYLVRHNDGSLSAYADDELTALDLPKVGVTRWQTFTLDLPWPGPEDRQFEAVIRAPAFFQKAVPMAVRSSLDPKSQPALKMKLVFLGCPDAEEVKLSFLLARSHEVMQAIAAPEMPKPQLLDVIMSPIDGEPLALWSMPTGMPMPHVPVVEVPRFDRKPAS